MQVSTSSMFMISVHSVGSPSGCPQRTYGRTSFSHKKGRPWNHEPDREETENGKCYLKNSPLSRVPRSGSHHQSSTTNPITVVDLIIKRRFP
jgi:hypothetical protein